MFDKFNSYKMRRLILSSIFVTVASSCFALLITPTQIQPTNNATDVATSPRLQVSYQSGNH